MNQVKKNSRRAFVDASHCVACGCCVKVCPRAAIRIANGITAQGDPVRCVGCGICARECPATVITIREAAL